LDEVGYDVEWQLLNSKYHVPQNRERVFIVCHLRGRRARQIFPLGRISEKTNEKIIPPENNIPVVNDKNGLREVPRAMCLDANYWKGHDYHGARTLIFKSLTERRTEEAKAIRKKSMQENGVDWSPRRGKELVPRNDELANCLTVGQTKEHLITDGIKIRKLTPVECERLQGFPDNWTQGISDTQRYKCCGNAVTVPVVQWIASHFEFPADLA